MSLQNLTTRLLQFNLWANDRMTSWLLTLDRKIIYTQSGSSFGTIDRTIQHILEAQIYWYNVIVKSKIDGFNLEPEKDITRLVAALIENSQTLVNEISLFNDQQLTETIQASDSRQSRYEYILHLVNHGSYHRGQIVTMCRILGVTGEIPVTDYDGYLWWLENR